MCHSVIIMSSATPALYRHKSTANNAEGQFWTSFENKWRANLFCFKCMCMCQKVSALICVFLNKSEPVPEPVLPDSYTGGFLVTSWQVWAIIDHKITFMRLWSIASISIIIIPPDRHWLVPSNVPRQRLLNLYHCTF